MNSIAHRTSFTTLLRHGAQPVWDEVINHPLFREISTDVVDNRTYEHYLRVEFGFVDTAARVLGLTISKAPSFKERRILAKGLYDLTTDQFDYFLQTFEQLGTAPEQVKASYRPLLSQDLHSLFETTAERGRYEEILTCMLAAEWIYLTWCSEAQETPSQRPHIASWVALHARGSFAHHVQWLREQLDYRGPNLALVVQARLGDLFEATLKAEIAFHTAVYEG